MKQLLKKKIIGNANVELMKKQGCIHGVPYSFYTILVDGEERCKYLFYYQANVVYDAISEDSMEFEV